MARSVDTKEVNKTLSKIEALRNSGMRLVDALKKVGVHTGTYYSWVERTKTRVNGNGCATMHKTKTYSDVWSNSTPPATLLEAAMEFSQTAKQLAETQTRFQRQLKALSDWR